MGDTACPNNPPGVIVRPHLSAVAENPQNYARTEITRMEGARVQSLGLVRRTSGVPRRIDRVARYPAHAHTNGGHHYYGEESQFPGQHT